MLDTAITTYSIRSILNMLRTDNILRAELLEKTKNLDVIYTDLTIGNRLQWYINNDIIICPICGNYVTKSKTKFNKTCSQKCQKLLSVKNKQITDMKRYGVNYYSGDKNKKVETLRRTCLERYGVPYTGGIKEFKEKREKTCIERYGYKTPLKNKSIREKIKQTNNEKYGVDNVFQSNIIKEKIKTTNIERYGVISPIQNESIRNKIISTNLNRYGVEWGLENTNIREKMYMTCLQRYHTKYALCNKDIYNKFIVTMVNKYGVKNPYCIVGVRKKAFSEASMEKRLTTMKRNNTFNASKSEDKLFQILTTIFPYLTIIRQYTDERYKNNENNHKYRCDFYIKEYDIFIEFNGSMFHNKRPFDINDSTHLSEANTLIEKHEALQKSKSRYLVTHYVWTFLDVAKRKTALNNNLRYIEIFDNKLNSNTINNLVKEIIHYSHE